MTTEIQIHPVNMAYGDAYATVRRWQADNAHVLALCPERWGDLSFNHKWVLLRILAARGRDYTPDWIDPAIWHKLAPQLRYVSTFDTDTDMLEDGRGDAVGLSRLSGKRLSPGTIDERGLEQEWEESVMGKAPQTMYDVPIKFQRPTWTNKGKVDGYE